jgi:hypothetical protein
VVIIRIQTRKDEFKSRFQQALVSGINIYRILIGEAQSRRTIWKVSAEVGKLKCSQRAETGYIWLRIWTSGGLCKRGNELTATHRHMHSILLMSQ